MEQSSPAYKVAALLIAHAAKAGNETINQFTNLAGTEHEFKKMAIQMRNI